MSNEIRFIRPDGGAGPLNDTGELGHDGDTPLKMQNTESSAQHLVSLQLTALRRQNRRHTVGFTLIELMITVAIVAILTAIAYPSYRNYVLRGQVVNATNGLSAMSANMERWFQDNRTYVGGPCTPPGTTYGSGNGSFTVSCPAALSNSPGGVFAGVTLAATTFQLEATGSGSTNGFNYFIDQQGNQGSVVVAPAPASWINTCATTWETKAGQC